MVLWLGRSESRKGDIVFWQKTGKQNQTLAKPKVWPNFGSGSPNPVQHPSPPGMARRCLESGWRSCSSLCSGPRILRQHRCHGQSGISVIILCLFFNNFVTRKFSCPILPCKFLYQCICPVLSKTAYSCSFIWTTGIKVWLRQSAPAYLVLVNIQYQLEPLSQTSTFCCILASSRSGSTYLGEIIPLHMWSCSC